VHSTSRPTARVFTCRCSAPNQPHNFAQSLFVRVTGSGPILLDRLSVKQLPNSIQIYRLISPERQRGCTMKFSVAIALSRLYSAFSEQSHSCSRPSVFTV